METKSMMAFLEQLTAHNELDWMHAHKNEYQQARSIFLELGRCLIEEISIFDPDCRVCDPAALCMRLNRDTRFSKDKSPYMPAFRMHLSPFGGAPVPVKYFVMLRPGQSFLGGGLFASMFPDATTRIRNKIVQESARFSNIISSPEFPFNVQGDSLKNVPRDFDKEHVHGEYLKMKSFYIEDQIQDELICDSDAFIDYAAKSFRQMKPFNEFLNEALEGFRLPERPR